MKKQLISIFLLFFIFKAIGQVDTLEIYSKVMDKTLKAAIVLPDGYKEAKHDFPVVYLLHGGSGRFSDWHKKTTDPNLLVTLVNQYQVLIVTPGVGPSSYYFDSPQMDSVQYESYLIKELIPFVDEKYKTISDRKGRAITGLSMGGHGAIVLSANNPELFTTAGSMSGVMNIDTRSWKVNQEFASQRRQEQAKMLGEIQYDPPFSKYTAVGLVDKMKSNGIALLLDCGVDDFLIATNRQIHQLLLENGIQHEYTERPGAHTWEYWSDALPFHLLFISREFKKNLP